MRHFVARFARRMQRSIDTISDATLAALRRHHWPGNVRELENLVERSIILSSGASLAVPLDQLSSGPLDAGAPLSLAATQRAHVAKVLASTNWKIGGPSGAAALLGMKRSSSAEAEDVVQEVWLRWQATDRSVVLDSAAFLVTTTTRLAINAALSARRRREPYLGPWLPEPSDTSADPELETARSEALGLAVFLLLEKLTPTERAAYVLSHAFD